MTGVLAVAARSAPLAAIMETVDDEVKALGAAKAVLRRQVRRSFVNHIRTGALRPGLTVARATDVRYRVYIGAACPEANVEPRQVAIDLLKAGFRSVAVPHRKTWRG